MKNEKHTLEDLEYGENTEKRGKWEMHIVGPEKWPKKKKSHCKTCKMRMHTVGPEIWREAQKNVENEKFTL